eukprot:8363389-Alexandrium_andersonii.AAC.1
MPPYLRMRIHVLSPAATAAAAAAAAKRLSRAPLWVHVRIWTPPPLQTLTFQVPPYVLSRTLATSSRA